MHDRALDHALEAQRRLRVNIVRACHRWRVLGDELREILAQIVNVGAHRAHHFSGGWIVEQRQQQVLDRDEFMALLPRIHKRHVQTDFKFLRNHVLPRVSEIRNVMKLYTSRTANPSCADRVC